MTQERIWLGPMLKDPKFLQRHNLTFRPKEAKKKGRRIIIGYVISNRFGPLKGCELIRVAGANEGDYHEQMNHQVCERWFINKVFPLMKKQCPDGKIALVMDNASFQSRQLKNVPTKNSKKTEMLEFIDKELGKVCSTSTPNAKLYDTFIEPIRKENWKWKNILNTSSMKKLRSKVSPFFVCTI